MNTYQAELYHYGIKNQKWGVRRFQKEDGSLTNEGRRRYGSPAGKYNRGKKDWQDRRNAANGSDNSSGGRMSTYGGQGKPATRSENSSGTGPVGNRSGGIQGVVVSRKHVSDSDTKIHTTSGKDKTIKTKYDFDVGTIREPMSVILKREKEKKRKVFSAKIGPDTNVDEITNEANTSAAASYTSNSGTYSKPVVKVKKSRYYSAGVNYVQQMLV